MTFENVWFKSLWGDYFDGNLSPVVASLILYAIAFCVCFVLHSITKLIVPRVLRPYTADFFKTLVICTFPYGHGVIRQHHGHVGFCIAFVPLIVITLRTFKEGLSSPLAVFMEFLDKKCSAMVMLLRISVQTLAGFASYQLASMVWSLEMHPSHVIKLQEMECMTELAVPVLTGFLVETAGVMFDTFVSFLPLSKNDMVDKTIKTFNAAILVCAGVQMTGMYMHPVMASGLTFFCHGTSALEHIFVYWVGGFLGCYVGLMLYKLISSTVKPHKPGKKGERDVSAINNGDTNDKERIIQNNNRKTVPMEKNASSMHYTRSMARQRKT